MTPTDGEALVVAALTAQFGDAIVSTETDDDLETQPRTHRVSRAGGAKLFVLDKPRIVIDSYAPSSPTAPGRTAARGYAYEVDEFMLFGLRGQTVNGLVVSHVTSVSGPTFVPDANTSLRHFVATYSLAIR